MPCAKPGRLAPVPSQTLLHFGSIALNPAVKRGVVDADATFGQHILQFTITDIMFTVPAYRPQNNATTEMPALEYVHE